MEINGIFRYSVIQQLPNNRQLRVDTGCINNKNIKIYSAYEGQTLKLKLYHLTTNLKNWYATKLKTYENNEVVEEVAYKRLDKRG